MYFLGFAALVFIIWALRGDDAPLQVDVHLECERLRRELDIQKEMTETFREAFLRQKAMHDRDLRELKSTQFAA